MRHGVIRCPIRTECDLCLMDGVTTAAEFRHVHADDPAVVARLAAGEMPHYSEIAPATWADLCAACDWDRYAVFPAPGTATD